MTESQATLEELQQRKAIADAEKAAIEAEIARDDAQRKLADSKTPVDATRLSQQARVSAAKKAKEVADADKALADAELAAIKAKIGEVPSAAVAGSVKVETSAASLETALLAARSTILASKTIAKTVLAAAGCAQTAAASADEARPPAEKQIFVFAAGELPDFQASTAFLAQRAIVVQALVNAVSQSNLVKLPAAAGGGKESVAAVGVALEAVTKILGFFRSDFEVRGSEVTADHALLATAVAGELIRQRPAATSIRVYLKALFNPAAVLAAGTVLNSEVGSLNFQRSKAVAALADMEKSAAQVQSDVLGITGDSASAEERRGQLGEQRKQVHDATERLKFALAAYNTLVAKLASPDASVAAMNREYEFLKAISDPTSFVLVVKMVKAGGSNYVRKDLWTNVFGAMPYSVMGGAIASYAMFQGSSGVVLTSGVVPVHGGFYKLNKVGQIFG